MPHRSSFFNWRGRLLNMRSSLFDVDFINKDLLVRSILNFLNYFETLMCESIILFEVYLQHLKIALIHLFYNIGILWISTLEFNTESVVESYIYHYDKFPEKLSSFCFNFLQKCSAKSENTKNRLIFTSKCFTSLTCLICS